LRVREYWSATSLRARATDHPLSFLFFSFF